MGSTKFFLPLTLLLSSWVFLGFSQLEGLIAGLSGGGGGGGAGGMACAQKLLPCQAYLKPPSSPPDSCCSPLKQMITEDTKCLCGIFNNQDLLKSFHVTQDEALKLLDECDVKADISQCNSAAGGGATAPAAGSSNSTAPPGSSNSTDPASNSTTAPTSSPTTPAADAPSTGSSDGNSTSTKSSASQISHLGGYGFIALMASLFI